MCTATTSGDDSRAPTPELVGFGSLPLLGNMTLAEYAFAAGKASETNIEAALQHLSSPVQQKLVDALSRFTGQLPEHVKTPQDKSLYAGTSLDDYASRIRSTNSSELKATLEGLSHQEQQRLSDAIFRSVSPIAHLPDKVGSLEDYILAAKAASLDEVREALEGLPALGSQKFSNALLSSVVKPCPAGIVAEVPVGVQSGTIAHVSESIDFTKYLAAAQSSSESEVRAALREVGAAERKKIADILARFEPTREALTAAEVPNSSGACKIVTTFMAVAVKHATTSEVKAILARVPRSEQLKISEALSRLGA